MRGLTLESDVLVFGRQILTSKVGPRAVRVKSPARTLIMTCSLVNSD